MELTLWEQAKSNLYAWGQAFMFMFWLVVAVGIINLQGVIDLPKTSIYLAATIGVIGTYFFALRKYERQLR